MQTENGEIRSLAEIAPMLPPDCWISETYSANEWSGEERVLVVAGDLTLERLDLDAPLGGDAADEPLYLIFVTGNLTVNGPIVNQNTDGATGLIVMGDLTAKDMVVGGQQVYVGKTLRVSDLFWGHYNHGELLVKGDAEARVMIFTDQYHKSFGGNARVRFLLDEERQDESPVDFSYDGLSLIFQQGLLREEGGGEGFLSELIDRDAVILILGKDLPVLLSDTEIEGLLAPTAQDLFLESDISVSTLRALVYCGLIEEGQTKCEGFFRDTVFRIGMQSVSEDGDHYDDRVFFTVADAYQFYLGVTEAVSQWNPDSTPAEVGSVLELEMVYRSIAREKEGEEWRLLTSDESQVWAECQRAWRGLIDYARKGIAQKREGFPLWQQVRAEVTCRRLDALISLPIMTERYNDWWDGNRNGYWSGYLWFGARQAVMFEGKRLTPMFKIAWDTGPGEDAVAAYWFEFATLPDGESGLEIDHTVNQNAGRKSVPRHAADHLARILRYVKSAEEKILADNARYLAGEEIED